MSQHENLPPGVAQNVTPQNGLERDSRYQPHRAYPDRLTRRLELQGPAARHKKSGLCIARYTVQRATAPKRKTMYGKTHAKRWMGSSPRPKRIGTARSFLFDAHHKICEYLTRWPEDSVKDTVSKRAYEHYEQIVKAHLKAALGGIKLKSLTPTCAGSIVRS